MTAALFLEQLLNGLQLGMTLFLMSAGLTLVFGVMGLINLAHGSLYMIGAFCCAWITGLTDSFILGLLAGFCGAAIAGLIIEMLVIRRLYTRGHLDQVLATFALILIISEGTSWIFGPDPLYLNVPSWLSGSMPLWGGGAYPIYRLVIIAIGLLIAYGLYLLITKTRLGMRIRAGESDREMIAVLGVAGAMVSALYSVEVGMGEPVLILALVVIVIGGIGSVKGALVASVLVGLVDTLGRVFLPNIIGLFIHNENVATLSASLASVLVYILMAIILALRPQGLFSIHD